MKKITRSLIIISLFMAGLSVFISCRKEISPVTKSSSNPLVQKADPVLGASNTVITIIGSGLGDIRSIMFEMDSVVAAFNPLFNTEGAIIFRVPTDAVPGQQNIIITNGAGVKITVPFNVLGLPTITNVSNYNFAIGTQITLTGKNLADVSKVSFNGSTEEVTIVSKTATTLVLTFPATTITRATLDITNQAGTITTTDEFVSLDNAFQIFTDGYGAGFDNASWGPAAISTTVFKSGTQSFAATYNKGNWSADGFANWNTGVPSMPDYKFLIFWVKGGSVDYTLYITGDKRAGGYGNSDQTAPIVVPANVWTYFKIPLSSLELWKTGSPFKQLGFWIKGPDAQDETFYFDDVIMVK